MAVLKWDLEALLSNLSSLLRTGNTYTLLITAIRLFYLLSSTAIITVCWIRPLRDRFLSYGARSQTNQASPSPTPQHDPQPSLITTLLDRLATLTVPHTWFTHFYVVSTALAGFRYILKPYLTRQGIVCSNFIFFHSLRRLSECLVLFKTTSSRMWVGHYAIGLAFYIVTNVAVFLEGIDWNRFPASSVPRALPVFDICPSRATESLLALILTLAMLLQFSQHQYLASLKKYTLPSQGTFAHVVAPHYTAECCMYLSVAILANGSHSLVNWTMLCATIFVLVNLGVTAQGTYHWLLLKFPDQRHMITRRYKMIPPVW
ncbi:hypothetical protein B0A52_05220 [Exophiala mesophila]|uniref:Polyprenal reductase n=1 Tax=Exophiala mesophila TaxID=212818 RepID=A0A438N4L5_EXOME|nr:hypothetical protein B0A52_05220 [Exophiala mesophila]